MANTVDFKIISDTQVEGMSLIYAQNEDSFKYLDEEMHMIIMNDGASPIFHDLVGDFISDAEHAHMVSVIQ